MENNIEGKIEEVEVVQEPLQTNAEGTIEINKEEFAKECVLLDNFYMGLNKLRQYTEENALDKMISVKIQEMEKYDIVLSFLPKSVVTENIVKESSESGV